MGTISEENEMKRFDEFEEQEIIMVLNTSARTMRQVAQDMVAAFPSGNVPFSLIMDEACEFVSLPMESLEWEEARDMVADRIEGLIILEAGNAGL